MRNFISLLALLGALCNATLVASGPVKNNREHSNYGEYSTRRRPPIYREYEDRGGGGGGGGGALQFGNHYANSNFAKIQPKETTNANVHHLQDMKQLQEQLQEQLQDMKQKLQEQLQDMKQELQKKELQEQVQDKQELQTQEEQVAQFKEQVAEFQEQVAKIQGQVANFQKQVGQPSAPQPSAPQPSAQALQMKVEDLERKVEDQQKNLPELKNLRAFETCSITLFRAIEAMNESLQHATNRIDECFDRDTSHQIKFTYLGEFLTSLYNQAIHSTTYLKNLIIYVHDDKNEAKELIAKSNQEAQERIDQAKRRGAARAMEGATGGARQSLARGARQSHLGGGDWDAVVDPDLDRAYTDLVKLNLNMSALNRELNPSKGPSTTATLHAFHDGKRRAVGASRTILFAGGILGFMIFTTVFISCVYHAMRLKQKQEDGRIRSKV